MTITQAGSANSRASERAAEKSLRLLNESSFPCSCSTRERRWRRAPALGVVRGALVRVLAVGEVEHLVERDDERVGELLARVEPGRDRGLVRGGVRERLGREAAARLERELTARAQLLENRVVLLGPADRRAVREVLRCAAQHRGAADVDRLDRLLLRHSPPRRDLLERIEVDADEVERLDPVLLERGDVFGLVAAGEDAGVDARVERLHAPAEHLRRGRDVLDALDRQADGLERGRSVPARHEPPAERDEPARERVQAGLVPGGDQRAHSSLTTSGSSRCSTDLIRSCRVSGVSPGRTGTRSCASTGPLSTPSSTQVHRRARLVDAGGELLLHRVRAGKGRQQRRVDVHHGVGEAVEERPA